MKEISFKLTCAQAQNSQLQETNRETVKQFEAEKVRDPRPKEQGVIPCCLYKNFKVFNKFSKFWHFIVHFKIINKKSLRKL